MPKKHRNPYLATKPSYIHSLSGGSGKPAADDSVPPSLPSVNDLLSQLRISQSSSISADRRKRELAELLSNNQRSLPPSLGQGILGLAPTAAPAPRHGQRSRIRLRTPGPAPPPSWQRGGAISQGLVGQNDEARRRAIPGPRTFGKKSKSERKRPEQPMRFLKLIGEGHVKEGSLLHLALRTAAENWGSIIEDVADDLDYLPVHLRSALLSYLAMYGPSAGVEIQDLRALFPDASDATCLDLSGLIGWALSLKDLRRWLTPPIKPARPSDPLNESIPSSTIAESWDDETSTQQISFTPTIIPPIIRTRLPFFLTKLSLAHPPPTISWNDLLSLSKDLGTLTHLSLAYWPVPTRTPNMKTASYISRTTGTEYAAGGTTLYSAIDGDMSESTIILRQLSEHTYCLRWLDLEGCASWLSAFVVPLQIPRTQNEGSTPSWSTSSSSRSEPQGPSWRGSWGNVSFLHLAQECTPRSTTFFNTSAFQRRMRERYPLLLSDSLTEQIIREVREQNLRETARVSSSCDVCGASRDGGASSDGSCGVCTAFFDQETARLAKWLDDEAKIWRFGSWVLKVRKGGQGGVKCVFDHGWKRKENYHLSW